MGIVNSDHDTFCMVLKELEFHNTISAMQPLQSQGLVRKPSLDDFGKSLSDEQYRRVNIIMNSASSVFDKEAQERKVVELKCIGSKQIISLENTLKNNGVILEDYQKAMFEDMTACIKVGLSRQAIVTAWMLGYDIIRRWVFSDKDRLKAFNTLLTNNKSYTEIVNYEDFFALNESFFLTVCLKASDALKVFTSKTHRKLENLLDDRNVFAHANFRQCTDTKAESFIERLFDEICEQPFIGQKTTS